MTSTPAATELLPRPESGRTFTTERRVRLSDTTADGRLRLDSLARYAQDVASDDARETMADDYLAWVVRRAVFEIHRAPVSEELCALTTWCSGYGGRWAERRTSLVGSDGGHCEGVVLWVAIDATTGAPTRLPATFHEHYDEACAGRRVSARLQHDDPPTDGSSFPWTFRSADSDRLQHVNNAAYWTVAEEVLAKHQRPATLRAELEYREPVEAGDPLDVVTCETAGTVRLWLTSPVAFHASLIVSPTIEGEP